MASITKLPSGAYRVQVRRKGRYASETFLRRDDAQKWARQAETLVDQGLPPNRSSVARLHTFGDLVDLHIADMCAVGKPPRRSKAATLATLKRDLGKEKIGHLDRHKLIEYGRKRADQGAGPVTTSGSRSLPPPDLMPGPLSWRRPSISERWLCFTGLKFTGALVVQLLNTLAGISASDPRLLRLVRLLAQQAARECYEEELRLAREKKREAPPG